MAGVCVWRRLVFLHKISPPKLLLLYFLISKLLFVNNPKDVIMTIITLNLELKGFNHLLMQVANELYFYLVKYSSLPANELYFTK